mgnify:CR=1 FL=1
MTNFYGYYSNYINRLADALRFVDKDQMNEFCSTMVEVWRRRQHIYLIGNGGSAGNSIHIANDFVYGAASVALGGGAKMSSLAANGSILTCLGNDLGYGEVFAAQLRTYGEPGDLLIVLSGSGNSKNILEALKVAKNLKMCTAGLLGFDGGAALDLVDFPVHIKVPDMQISEDFQLIFMHALMQYVNSSKD